MRFVQFGLNISKKHIKVLILVPFRFFWHPWHPWGRVHIDLNKNRFLTGCVICTYLSSQEQEVATDEVKTVIEVNVKVAAEVMVKIVIQVVEKM